MDVKKLYGNLPLNDAQKKALDQIDSTILEERHKQAWDSSPAYRELFKNNEDADPYKSSSFFRRAIGDTAVSAAKGVVGLGESAVGLADIPTVGYAGKILQDTTGYDPAQTRSFLDQYYSPEQKQAFEKVNQAKGFLPTVKAAVENPSTIVQSTVESIPSMLGGRAIATGLMGVAPKLSPIIAGAIGEGAVSAGQTAEQIRQGNKDGSLTAGQAGIAALSGTAGGAIGALSGKLAGKLGIADIDLPDGGVNRSDRGIIANTLLGAIQEGALEELPQSAIEQAAQNIATGKPLDEGVANAAAQGMITGMTMGAGGEVRASMKGPERPSNATDQTQAEAQPSQKTQPSPEEQILLNPDEISRGVTPEDILTGTDESRAASEFSDAELNQIIDQGNQSEAPIPDPTIEPVKSETVEPDKTTDQSTINQVENLNNEAKSLNKKISNLGTYKKLTPKQESNLQKYQTQLSEIEKQKRDVISKLSDTDLFDLEFQQKSEAKQQIKDLDVESKSLNKKISNLETFKRLTPKQEANLQKYNARINEIEQQKQDISQVFLTEKKGTVSTSPVQSKNQKIINKTLSDIELADQQQKKETEIKNKNVQNIEQYPDAIKSILKQKRQEIIKNEERQKQIEEARKTGKIPNDTKRIADYQSVIKEGSPRYQKINKSIHAVDIMLEQSANSQSRSHFYDEETDQHVAVAATSPAWMKKLNGSLSRQAIENLATKYKNQILLGKTDSKNPITEKQMENINKHIIPSIEQIQKDHADEFRTRADYEKEGYKFVSDPIVAFDFKKGDTILDFNGQSGKHQVLGEERGDVLIKSPSGQITKVDGLSAVTLTAFKDWDGKDNQPEGYTPKQNVVKPVEKAVTADQPYTEKVEPLSQKTGMVTIKTSDSDKVQYSFAGEQATSANAKALQEANAMKNNGENKEKIWNKTGWWEISPGQWSFEIDDSKTTINNDFDQPEKTFGEIYNKKPSNKKSLVVGDIIDSTELFSNYPSISKIPVEITDKEGMTAGLIPKINDKTPARIIINKDASLKNIKSVLSHELQHFIQLKERFAQGVSPETIKRQKDDKIFEDNEFVKRTQGEYLNRLDTFYEKIKSYDKEHDTSFYENDEIPPGYEKEFNEINSILKSPEYLTALKYTQEHQAIMKDPVGSYYRMTGEVESRLVQKRLDMTPEERKAEPPFVTLENMLKSEGLLNNGKKAEDVLISRKYDDIQADLKPSINRASIQNYFKKKNQQSGVNEDGSIWVRLNNGTGFNVQTVKRMSDTEYHIALSSGKMEKNGQIAGQITKNNIKLATDFATMQTLDHELVHLMENTGIISRPDTLVMDNKIRSLSTKGKLGFELSKDQMENRANFLSQVLKDRKAYANTPIGRIIQKIGDFIDSLLHIGRQSVRKIARGVETGKIFDKQGKMGTGLSQYQSILNTDTPAFKKWFGDSKVVDNEGKPLVVYHGTVKAGFNDFTNKNDSSSLWFTANSAYANAYTGDINQRFQDRIASNGDTPGIYSVYLNIRNPLDLRHLGDTEKKAPLKKAIDDIFNKKISSEDYLQKEQPKYFEQLKNLEKILSDKPIKDISGIEKNLNNSGIFIKNYGADVIYVDRLGKTIIPKNRIPIRENNENNFDIFFNASLKDGERKASDNENTAILKYEKDRDRISNYFFSKNLLSKMSEVPIYEIIRTAKPYFLKMGYDGLIVTEQGNDVYAAFEPTQIKSVYNTGSFDPNNPDIRYSIINPRKKDKPSGYQSSAFREILPEKVAKQMEINRGVRKTPLLERLSEVAGKIKQERYHFPELMKDAATPSRSLNQEILRRQQDVGQVAQDQAKRNITEFIAGLDREGMDMYALNIILADEVRMIENGLREDGKLPNGFDTTTQVIDAYEKLKAETARRPAVERALQKRNSFHNQIARQLVKYGIMPKQILKSDDYFHHQVLKYFNEKQQSIAAGSPEVRNKWRGWMKGRVVNAEEYNTEYLEAEFMVLAQQIAQIKTAENLAEIEKENNVMAKLKQEAKAANLKAIQDTYQVLADNGKHPIDPATGKAEDPFKPFNKKIAMGFSKLSQLAKKNQLIYDQDYENVVKSLKASSQGGAMRDPMLFEFLSHLIDRKAIGSDAAALVYKGIKGKDRFIRDTLGDQLKTYKNIIPATHMEWAPKPGNKWFWTNSIGDRVLQDVLDGVKSLDDKDVRQVLARGKETTWVIPKGLASQMDKLRPSVETTILEKSSAKILNTWKQWILLNPLSVVRYNLNNASGDLDAVLAYNPAIAKGSAKALSDLRKWTDNKNISDDLHKELTKAQNYGVVGSGFSVQEVEDVLKAMSTDKLVREVIHGENPGLIAKLWQTSKKWTGIREDTLRLAAYRWFKTQLESGKENLYGASNPQDIRNLLEKGKTTEAAAKLARELLGDYGNISAAGEVIRRRMIPFWAWTEINLPRYVRMMRNLREEGGSTKGLSFVMAKRAAVFATKASMLAGAIMLWNATVFPDEEEELGESGRGQLHLILGRHKDGSIISVRMQGALTDALSWFGAEDLPGDIADLVKDRATIQDKLIDIPKAIMNKGVNSLRPEPKLLYESITGQSAYPDVLAPRPIRDKVENALRTFKLDSIYRHAMGRPGRGGSVAKQLVSDLEDIFTYTTEPGVQAYYDSRKIVMDWKKENGIESGGGTPTKRGNALYYYKQALKYGDLPAAQRYLKKYYELGGSYDGMKQSIRMAHPLSGIRKMDRYKFKQSLSAEESAKIQKGIEWYQKTYL